MDFDGLVLSALAPSPNRVEECGGEFEHHLTEAAVIVAYAMHPLRMTKAGEALVHPDGEHGKRFGFAGWLAMRRRRKDETTSNARKGRAISAAFF
ncbi:hypothetical protein ABIB80_000268 [Bradyrhizobium sp. i1.15.2]|uniref:hypothetical protein n=1 Tax=Bradyrhizobium sp. i1.15.2 TaxID=3156362 RepID=UPI003396E769